MTYGGLTVHPPAAWHVNVATGLSALMWRVPRAAAPGRQTRRRPSGRRRRWRADAPSLPHPLTFFFFFFLSCRFWVLLRWKEDGATLLFGHAPHFEHDIAEERKAEAEALLYKPRPAAG